MYYKKKMGDIYDTNSQFEFDKISLITPTTISGGVHFSKILINKKQLYIQSPKCKTKQGIVKSGKKSHADLVFTNDDEEFIQWIETLEQTVRKHIYTNREKMVRYGFGRRRHRELFCTDDQAL